MDHSYHYCGRRFNCIAKCLQKLIIFYLTITKICLFECSFNNNNNNDLGEFSIPGGRISVSILFVIF